ncbi:MAG: B12-binding domain-containing radical SAM protein [Planctomycetes bacterium]|nr:B12-binding domain-containing radical SAM protein [Planctomycetota bacterium]
MKVLFIYPSIDCPAGVQHGLASISAVLKSAGHDVRLIHLNEHLWPIPSNPEILGVIQDYQPGIIGFSVMSQQYGWTCKLAQDIRARFPSLPLCIGGVHCTMVPDEVAQSRLFDFVCVGEGEYPFLELVNRLENGRDPSDCPNLRICKPSGEIVNNRVGPFPDLDKLPLMDWDLFDMKRITQVKKGWLSILTSRGCPYKCTYCFNKEIVDQYLEDGAVKSAKEYLRHHPIDVVLDEIRYLKSRLPEINTIIFDDDLFTLNKKYVLDFCRAYKDSGIGIPFVVNAHVQVFTDEVARALKEAGCMICKFGLESGSDRIRRDILWRFMTNDTIERAFAAAHHHDIHTSAFIMFGLPTETREEILETLELCSRIKMGRYRWALFFPFPGTAGYTIAKSKDLIDFGKMERLGNYFDGTCLKFGPEQDLWLEKVSKVCCWWVNALSDWPSARLYRSLVEEIEALSREEWEERKKTILDEDREISEELLAKGIPHYSIRYTHVMGVHSDFVLKERARLRQFADAQPITYTLD